MEYTKENIAYNIACLRQSAGMTQAEFAKKLNYTDKAISKWERAESIPDVFVLATIAGIFGVTVDYLLVKHEGSDFEFTAEPKKHYNKLVISLLSIMPVWIIATLVYVAGVPFIEENKLWLVFIAAVPVTIIVLLVFNCIWGKTRMTYILVSLLVWSLLGFAYLLFMTVLNNNYWLVFVVGIPCQTAIFLWSKAVKYNNDSKIEKNKQ